MVDTERTDAAQAGEAEPAHREPTFAAQLPARSWPSWFSEIGRWRADVQR